MTGLSILLQTMVIVRQRSKIASSHRHCSRHPEFRISKSHYAPSEMVINDILGCLHCHHRDHTHTHCCARCHWPRELVNPPPKKYGLKNDRCSDAGRHCVEPAIRIELSLFLQRTSQLTRCSHDFTHPKGGIVGLQHPQSGEVTKGAANKAPQCINPCPFPC